MENSDLQEWTIFEWHIPDFSLSILTILPDFTMAKRLRNGKVRQMRILQRLALNINSDHFMLFFFISRFLTQIFKASFEVFLGLAGHCVVSFDKKIYPTISPPQYPRYIIMKNSIYSYKRNCIYFVIDLTTLISQFDYPCS